jgi:tetratricopeptide (TPR) repeat protein
MGFGCLLCLGFLLAPPQNAPPPETAAGLLQQARNLVEQQHYDEALKTLERCLARDGRSAEAYKLVAISAIRLDRLEIAEPALRSAAELSPNDYVVHFHVGALHYTRSLFQSAKAELEKAIELQPGYVPAHLFLALTLEEVGNPTTAIETYRRAIALAEAQHATADTAYLYLGRYLYRLNRFDESLPLLRKAVELNPASGEALLALGKTFHGLDRNDEAVAALQRAAAADGQGPEAHYYLFRIFSIEHRDDEARAELAQFQQLKQKPGNDVKRRLPQSQ